MRERARSGSGSIRHDIFEPEGAARTGHAKRYSDILIAIGRKGDLTSKVRESLVSIGRVVTFVAAAVDGEGQDRKSTRLNSSHLGISYAVFCLKKKKTHKYA